MQQGTRLEIMQGKQQGTKQESEKKMAKPGKNVCNEGSNEYSIKVGKELCRFVCKKNSKKLGEKKRKKVAKNQEIYFINGSK